MNEKKFKLPHINIRMPKFWAFRMSLGGGVYLGGGKLLLGSVSIVVIGFVLGIFTLVNTGEQQITFPMLGAEYTAPNMVGNPIVDREFPADRSQTLQINIPAQTRLDEITLKNISLGKFGLTDSFELTGTSTSDVLTIDELVIKNSEFPSMDWANGDIYLINATSSVIAAGHTFSPTMSSTTNDVVIGSGRGATSYIAEDMIVDRIIIRQSTTGGDVIIGKLILDGVKAWTGGFDADYFEVGTLTLENVRIGDDGDINSADLVINSSVNSNTINDGVQEEPVFIR
tara:strand:- start:583 stop:1437 length:855 start_codon:yes stop_codon:yes gene_type:complete